MPNHPRAGAPWCAAEPHDCTGLQRNGAAPCPRLGECPDTVVEAEEDLDHHRLQPGQPLLLIYRGTHGPREVFGEVKVLLKQQDVIRLYLDDGRTDAILLRLEGRLWLDVTNHVFIRVVEELSGAQLSRFMLYRDYAHSGCPQRHQPSLKGLRASA